MTTRIDVTLMVNGERVSRSVDTRLHLVDFLRSELGLAGAHTGCEHGVCGACTVRLDGAVVETIEGLSDSGEIRDLQEAFVARNACQCGYCTPGMLVTAADILTASPQATREEIREHISGNYCRCTGYQAIVDAVEDVLKARAAKREAA